MMQQSDTEIRRASILRSIDHIKELVKEPSNAVSDQSAIDQDGRIVPALEPTDPSPLKKVEPVDSSLVKHMGTSNEVTMIHGLILNEGGMETHEVRANNCITTPLLQVFQLTQTEQLTVGGTTSIQHVLDVSGESTFSSIIHANGIHDSGNSRFATVVIDHSLELTGTMYTEAIHSSQFEIDAKGNMDMSGDLWVGGHTSVYGGMGISAGLVVHDDAYIMGSTKTPLLQVYELLTVGTMPPTPGHLLNVAGDATFTGTIHTQGLVDTGISQVKQLTVTDQIQVGKVWITTLGIMVLFSTTGYPAIWQDTLTQLTEPIPDAVTHLYIVTADSNAVCKINAITLEYVSNTVLSNGPCTVYFVVNYIST